MSMTPRARFVAHLMVSCVLLPAASLAQAQIAATPSEIGSAVAISTLVEEGTSVEWGRAEGVVEGSVDEVMAIVQSYGQYANFLPHFKVSRVLSQRGASANVYMEVGILKGTVTIWAQLAIRAKRNEGETRVIEARMTDGNITRMNARWEVTPLSAGHTRVAFQMLIDPDLPVPSSLVTAQNAKAAERTIRALRKRLLEASALRR
jgi:ribosome-associated toxin RatA of RatAB toxin-antitoxin module